MQPSNIDNKAVKMFFGLLLITMAIFAVASASAGADATFLAPITTLTGWITGSLGRMIAIASLIIGVITAMVMKSLMPLTISVGISIAASVGPSVLTGIVTATL